MGGNESSLLLESHGKGPEQARVEGDFEIKATMTQQEGLSL